MLLIISFLLTHVCCQTLPLIISEIMYNPAGLTESDWIELKAVGENVCLDNLAFTSGISVPLGPSVASGGACQQELAADQYYVVATNITAFSLKYGQASSNGGSLSSGLKKSGEKLKIQNTQTNATIIEFTYGDGHPWPKLADGFGYSLVPLNDTAVFTAHFPLQWRNSAAIGGTPFAADPGLTYAALKINEIAAAEPSSSSDWVEIYNPTSSDVTLANWYLSTNGSNLLEYALQGTLTVSSMGYLAVDVGALGLDLPRGGETLYLVGATGSTPGYVHSVKWNTEMEEGETLGLYEWPDLAGEHLAVQSAPSKDQANAGPKLPADSGGVIVFEIQYHPPNESAKCVPTWPCQEYVRLFNTNSDPVLLYDEALPEHVWKLSGVDADIPEYTKLAGYSSLWLTPLVPSVFQDINKLPPLDLVIQYKGGLQGGGETLRLLRPGPTDAGGAFDKYLVDIVDYGDKSPWPTLADGGGPGLRRCDIKAYGNDPASWDTECAEDPLKGLPLPSNSSAAKLHSCLLLLLVLVSFVFVRIQP